MPTQDKSSHASAREAAEAAFLTKFKFNEFGCKPCDPPFSYSEPSWANEMKALGTVMAKAGFTIPNIAEAARKTLKVPIKDGIEELAKLVAGGQHEAVSKSSDSKPKSRSIWSWVWKRGESS